MLYYSTNQNSPKVNFKDATIKGQPPDKGLYFPESIPVLPKKFIKNISNFSNEEIAFKIINPYIGDVIPKNDLERIIAETINFNFPLIEIKKNIFSLELFHGPTLAFKDVGARFMSRCLGYFVKDINKKVTVLVATSGDTGGAVANGFYNVAGVDVIILYPACKVSHIQELQLTTTGKNITALEVDGTFDDCQYLVKQAFGDNELNKKLFLTSANSINVARWLPQQFYYFFAFKQWHDKNNPPVISVPSGNFGNICAGLLARQSGLPVQHFVAACNANDAVYHYLKTGKYTSRSSVATLSNAMDVGNPSNFIRVLEIFNHQHDTLKKFMSGYTFSDKETAEAIKEIFIKTNYLLDPHGAIGYLGLEKYLQQHSLASGIFLETAHPVKFYDAVHSIIQKPIPIPGTIKKLLKSKKKSVKIGKNYTDLKAYLLSSI